MSRSTGSWVKHAIRLARDHKYRMECHSVLIGGQNIVKEYFENKCPWGQPKMVAVVPEAKSLNGSLCDPGRITNDYRHILGNFSNNILKINSNRLKENDGAKRGEISIGLETLKRITREAAPDGIVAEIPLVPTLMRDHMRTLILVEPRLPGNLGCLIRTATILGWTRVVIVGVSCVDPYDYSVVRASRGSIVSGLVQINRFPDWRMAKEVLSDHRILCALADGRPLDSYKSVAEEGVRIAVVLGNESRGIPEEISRDADRVAIAGAAHNLSFNVASAGAIIMHYLRPC